MSGDVIVEGLPYPIVLAADAAQSLPPLLGGEAGSAAVVYDNHVEARARAIIAALHRADIDVRAVLPVGGGESFKTQRSVEAIYTALLGGGADRRTAVIAIGGGTVTDVVGFAAATYMRGVRWIAVPTTVLGMADAAIGGKTGIDLPQGKNLAGAFWNPSAVVADVASLATLPLAERQTGLAEAVKCAIIGDPPLLDVIERFSPGADPSGWTHIIAAAAGLKARIVASDPREGGARALLNLGHTVAHALELAGSYRMTHGHAVSVGLRAEGLIAGRRVSWPDAEHARMLAVLRRLSLPLHVEGLSVEQVLRAMKHDKKNVGGRIRFVLPARIGDVRYGIDVDAGDVRAALQACGQPPDAAELNG